jgi:hypothetical protein
LRYVCTLVCTLFAIFLLYFITLQYLCTRIAYELHSNCARIAFFSKVALELHSNCTRIAFFSNVALVVAFCLQLCCIVFALFVQFPQGHYFCILYCTRIALELHSLINSPRRHYLLRSLFQSGCCFFLLFGKFRRGHYLLHSNCTRIAHFIAIELHSNCTRIALFSNIALELHSNCTLFKRCTLCCTL